MAEFADKTHTDVSLWDALELREPMEGLSKGAHGYVVGWTGSAYGGRAPHLDPDTEVGTAFYRSAAELDHARGCLALADAISQADGDAAEAERWLHRAAWLGDDDAVRVCREAGYAPEPPHPSICAERERLRQRLSTLAVAAGRAPVVSPKKGLKKNFV